MLVYRKPKDSSDPPIALVHRDGKTRKVYVTWDKSNTSATDHIDLRDTDATAEPLPFKPTGQRFAAYVAGMSGSGKSTQIARLVKQLKKSMDAEGKKRAFIFSAVTQIEDPALEGVGAVHLKYENKEALLQLKPEHLANSILLFDDAFSGQDVEIARFMRGLLKSCLQLGRKMNINILTVSHQIMEWNKTRDTIFESSHFVLFPVSNRNASLRFIKSYLDPTKAELDEIRRLDEGRYTSITVHKGSPRYWISSKQIRMLS